MPLAQGLLHAVQGPTGLDDHAAAQFSSDSLAPRHTRVIDVGSSLVDGVG
jgi:hypothetical protein